MNDYQRIENILKYLDITARALSFQLGMKSPQTFYDIKAGKCGISKDLASKIHEKYDDINVSWILTGEGEMLKSETTAPITQTVNGVGNNNVKISTMDKALDEISEQRKLTAEALRQNAELIGIIKNLTNKG